MPPQPEEKSVKDERHDGRNFVEALARGLRVLEAFTPQSPSLGLSELSRRVGLDKRTTYRLASTLQALEYLSLDPAQKTYRPSTRVLNLGFAVLESMELRQRARPHVEHLARETEEFVSLAVLEGRHIVYVDTIRAVHTRVGIQTYIGFRDVAHGSSHGKVQLAELTDEALGELYADVAMEAQTPHTITDLVALRKELERVRRNHYAVNDEESSIGVRSVAAPIRSRDGVVVGSVNIAVLAARYPLREVKAKLADRVIAAAAEISATLGNAG